MKYDNADLEALDQTLRSPGYRLILECLDRVRHARIRELCAPSTGDKTAELRGNIAALEMVSTIGKQLRKDIATNLRQAPEAAA